MYTSVNGKIKMYIWGCGQNPGPNRLLLGGLQCIRMKRESKQWNGTTN